MQCSAEPPLIDLERDLSADSDTLNPLGVNVLRELGNPAGIYVWGARTLTDNTLRPFVASARFLRHLEFSISSSLASINDIEPGAINPLIIELLIEDYLDGYFMEGAFSGFTADEAYFVSCHNQLPYLTCVVGVAMQRPAEFESFQLNIAYRDVIFQSRFVAALPAPTGDDPGWELST